MGLSGEKAAMVPAVTLTWLIACTLGRPLLIADGMRAPRRAGAGAGGGTGHGRGGFGRSWARAAVAAQKPMIGSRPALKASATSAGSGWAPRTS